MATEQKQDERYPPIGDYGFLADCHSTALVSRTGSIDWCCMPRIDSGSIFSRLLDWDKGGYCRISPASPFTATRRYLPETLILETTFVTEGGEAKLIDCFPMHKGGRLYPYQQILRFMEGVKGEVQMAVEVVPRFDYGAILPWIVRKQDCFLAFGGSNGLQISGDVPLEVRNRHDLSGGLTLGAGDRCRLSILFRRPEVLDGEQVECPSVAEMDRRLQETVSWWQEWASQGSISGPYSDLVLRSAIVLKGLSNAPTGAIAAAATTSLPEAPGSIRNWDYRFSWIRDSVFATRSLAELGYMKEADEFRRFVERSAAGSAEELQVLFGVGGERFLREYELGEIEGYRGSRPVRIGNAAARQHQHDMYGELLDNAWRWHQGGQSPDDDYWNFLVEIVNTACRTWRKPDQGIWEIRGPARHFVHSKVMCWSAMERGLGLARELGRQAPVREWERERDEIRRTVERLGYDKRRGIFVGELEGRELDASLLLLPVSNFVLYRDERMVRTTDAVREELEEGGLLLRYPRGSDGLQGKEGTFLASSFWLAECLARQGRGEEAHKVFSRAIATGNDLGLFPEQFDAAAGEMRGNFPQGLTHFSLIMAATALAAAR